mgnify:CR=1 FL=1
MGAVERYEGELFEDQLYDIGRDELAGPPQRIMLWRPRSFFEMHWIPARGRPRAARAL